MKFKPDILIIGAGISGISSAIMCERNGLDYIILEKSHRPGGRIGSVYEEGYTFDIGFQVFNTAYHVAKSLMDIDTLNLKYFKPGALIHSGESCEIISDPMRDISQIFTTLFSKIPSFADKLKILKLKNSLLEYSIDNDLSDDKETIAFLKDYGFSDKFINNFFYPFFSGIFLENELITSSKFFKYVFSKFSNGLASIPAKGMQEIPNNMLKKINNDSLLYDREVKEILSQTKVKLSDGQILEAKQIIFTGESQALVKRKNIKYNSVKTLYFSIDALPPSSNYIHLFPNDRLINNIAFLTSISKEYSKKNDHLISVTILEKNVSKSELVKYTHEVLKNFYGGDINFLKYYNIKKATIFQPVGFYHHHQLNENNFYFTGDNLAYGSIEGAVLSGIKVVDNLSKSFG